MREFQQAKRQQRLAEAAGIGQLPIVNLPPAEHEEERNRLHREAQEREKAAEKAERWESVYFWLWRWDGRVARLLFPVGLASLLYFAVRNM